MDLWFFLLLLGSGLISIGANNVTTGKQHPLSPLFRPKTVVRVPVLDLAGLSL